MKQLLSYPRSILMATIYLPFLILMSGMCVLLNLIFNRRDVDGIVIRSWARLSCWMFGVKLDCVGLENIPHEGCLFVFNHTSFFDIFAMAALLPDFRFGAKIELFKIPVFGFAMRRIGILPIDRRNREGVFRVYREAQVRMRKGERFALAPEGTRQPKEKLGAFKSGPFIFAINTGAPIVPVVVRNASQILPKHSVFPNFGTWSRTIHVRILPAIDTRTLTLEDRPILQERVRKEMLPFFIEDVS